EADRGARLAQPGLRDLQILVGGGDLLLERAEVGIGEQVPPGPARQMIAGLRHLPPIGLLVGRCRRRRRLDVVGADHAAAEQKGGEPRQGGGPPPHFLVPGGGAPAIRTRVPLVRESEGATMTWSVGWSPVRIST